MSSRKSLDASRKSEYQLRYALACTHLNTKVIVHKIPDNWARFSKSLRHLPDGNPDPVELEKLLAGVRKCKCSLDKINYPGTLRLVNPSAIYSWDLSGPFKSNIPVPLPPSDVAAELEELHSLVTLRDVPFKEEAFLSQFFLFPTTGYQPGLDFMTTKETYLNIQNGIVTEKAIIRKEERYITTLRDGCAFLHQGDLLQLGMQVAANLKQMKCPGVQPIKPTQETLLLDLGMPDLMDLMCRAVKLALSATWYHKWSLLRIRPEAAADKLLPQAYPEGAPCHPSFPSGHAAVAGALITILKAFYDETWEIPAYKPNEEGTQLVPLDHKLPIGQELDKLASNVGMFRLAAGVNYRSDLVGIDLGEEVAIQVLKDATYRYSRDVEFKFHKRNGELVEIKS